MRIVKQKIDNVLRKMCFGTTREHSEQMVERIYQTNVIYDNCVIDSKTVTEELIVSALMEIVYENYTK